jgi:hypothetical protein
LSPGGFSLPRKGPLGKAVSFTGPKDGGAFCETDKPR